MLIWEHLYFNLGKVRLLPSGRDRYDAISNCNSDYKTNGHPEVYLLTLHRTNRFPAKVKQIADLFEPTGSRFFYAHRYFGPLPQCILRHAISEVSRAKCYAEVVLTIDDLMAIHLSL